MKHVANKVRTSLSGEMETSLEKSPSPSPSSGSDDFAALLDAELLTDRHSTASDTSQDENLRSEQNVEEEEAEVEDSDVEEEQEDGLDVIEDLEAVLQVEEEDDLLDSGGSPVQDFRWLENRKRKRGDDDDVQLGSPDKRQVVANGKCPPHPGFMWGVCIRCGEQKSTTPSNDPVQSGVALRYIHEGLEVSELEATRVRSDELKRVTGKKKLLLVVDLDHTMLNSARFIEVSPEEEAYLAATYLGPEHVPNSEATTGDNQGSRSSLHRLTRLQMWTKLRPFAHKFLEEASKLYEMYVYTMGEKIYALAMVQLLDPTGRLFGDRIISQLDSTKRNTKDLDVVLGAESAVIILDDTEGVWPKHRSNLILMERYHFFSSSRRQFGVKSQSLAEAHRDESETEGTLATTLQTLRSLHQGYFYGRLDKSLKRRPLSGSSDVREVIRSIRGKVLADCSIVFSRIFPTGMPNPDLHPFWQLTVDLGAKCSTSCDHTTTHVVALDRGTDKARWAKQHQICLVHPSWVEAAQYLWRRPPESDYPVTDDTSGCPVPTFAKSIIVERRVPEVEVGNGDVGPYSGHESEKKLNDNANSENLDGTKSISVRSESLPFVHVNGSKNAGSEQKDKGIG